LNVEMLLSVFVDDGEGAVRALGGSADAGAAAPGPASVAARAPEESAEAAKSDHVANPGKQLDLVSGADGHTWRRFPLQTELVARGDDIVQLARERVERFAANLPEDAM